uniref:DUF7894 domain-containing protein n=1 Tax=Kalanchoe fedtschenkoi TaxID=63787 RepID=A0A7N0TU50_KALFE
MKVGLKTIVFIRDAGGFGDALSAALHPQPHSSLRRLEESFELSLEHYGIRDRKASGRIVHFVDDLGVFQNYETPILACAFSEVLKLIMIEQSSARSTFIFPFLVSSSKLRRDAKSIKLEDKMSLLYGVPLGSEIDGSQALAAKTQKPPPSLQINHEPLACVLHIARVLKLPAFILIGQEGQRQDRELIDDMGELLAGSSSLLYSKDKLVWHSVKSSQEGEEPWRALYG